MNDKSTFIKFTMYCETDKLPAIDCSLKDFFKNVSVLDYDYKKISKKELNKIGIEVE